MAARDPETGQFVASEDTRMPGWHDTHRFLGTLYSEIPAADLSGGTTVHEAAVDSGIIEVIDFTEHLGSDEIFEVLTMVHTATLTLHTTATAEGYGELAYEFSPRNGAEGSTTVDPPFFGGTAVEDGNFDVVARDDQGDQVLHKGFLAADASVVDSGSSAGAGADHDRERRTIPFAQLFGSGPTFDGDDAFQIPHELRTDNISDHAISAAFHVMLHGVVHEV